jgi:hypothetical protein
MGDFKILITRIFRNYYRVYSARTPCNSVVKKEHPVGSLLPPRFTSHGFAFFFAFNPLNPPNGGL